MRSAGELVATVRVEEWLKPRSWDETDVGPRPLDDWVRFHEERRDYSAMYGPLREVLAKTPEFVALHADTVKAMSTGFPVPHCHHHLEEWMKEAVNSRVSGIANKQEKAERLLADLGTNSCELESRLLLDGLDLGFKRMGLTLGKANVVLSQATVADMAFRPSKYPRNAGMVIVYPSAVLTVRRRGKPISAAQCDTQRVIVALRLVGAGFFRKLQENYGTVVGGGGVEMPHNIDPAWPTCNRLRIDECDRVWLRKLLTLLWPLVGGQARLDENTESVGIAFKRYCSSVEPRSCVDERILPAIMGLEALYLPHDNMGQMRRTLCMRAAKLLSIIGGVEPLDVTGDLAEGYKARSKYVHGSRISSSVMDAMKKDYGSVQAFARRLSEYLRLSIIMFLATGATSKRRKETLQGYIDNALLGPWDSSVRAAIRPWQGVLRKCIRVERRQGG